MKKKFAYIIFIHTPNKVQVNNVVKNKRDLEMLTKIYATDKTHIVIFIAGILKSRTAIPLYNIKVF